MKSALYTSTHSRPYHHTQTNHEKTLALTPDRAYLHQAVCRSFVNILSCVYVCPFLLVESKKIGVMMHINPKGLELKSNTNRIRFIRLPAE